MKGIRSYDYNRDKADKYEVLGQFNALEGKLAGALYLEFGVNETEARQINEIEDRRVVAKEDYLLSVRTESDGNKSHLKLPKSNVLKFFLEDGSWVVVRPSGNEPKLKLYKNLIKKKSTYD